MGQTLGWMPAAPEETTGRVDIAMRERLIERCANGDPASIEGVILDRTNLQWLEGIIAGAPNDSSMHEDATALIEAINKFGRIQLAYDR